MKKSRLLMAFTFGFLCLSLLPAKTQAKRLPFNLSEKRYKQLLELTVVDMGNNARLKSFIKKMKDGQDVYVAAIGGSVTEGVGPSTYRDGYAYRFQKSLADTYMQDKTKLHFAGAGLSGTPSTLGLVRYQSDVVQELGHTPDLLVVEFAVNDSSSSECKRAFEAIIRTALESSPDTAVIALYSAAEYGNQQSWMSKISSHYSIPQVSTMNLVTRALLDQDFKSRQFYTDQVHPTREGHTLQAEVLMNLLKKTEKAKLNKAAEIPEPYCSEKPFFQMQRITEQSIAEDQDLTVEVGPFTETDTMGQNRMSTGKTNFPQNWYKHSAAKKGKESMKVTVNCRTFILVYKESAARDDTAFGKAEVYVDGQYFATYDGSPSSGWNNAQTRVIIDQEECASHTVEIWMAKGDEGKDFTILAMSYSK